MKPNKKKIIEKKVKKIKRIQKKTFQKVKNSKKKRNCNNKELI